MHVYAVSIHADGKLVQIRVRCNLMTVSSMSAGDCSLNIESCTFFSVQLTMFLNILVDNDDVIVLLV